MIALLEGLIRLAIFIGYIALISLTPDIKRVFMYHGAEHKCINCIEHGMELNVENVRKSSRQHKRCGTSFLLIVFVISIILFTLVGYQGSNVALRFLSRIILLPIVAGISYEVLKGLAHSESKIAKILRWPGMQMQRLTTRPPTNEMLEVAIVSMNVALYGLPKNCETTPEGYTIIRDYRITDPDYVPSEAAE